MLFLLVTIWLDPRPVREGAKYGWHCRHVRRNVQLMSMEELVTGYVLVQTLDQGHMDMY